MTPAEKKRIAAEAKVHKRKLAEMQDVLTEDKDGAVKPDTTGRSIMD